MSEKVDELAARIAARLAEDEAPDLSDAQIEAAARILGPSITGSLPGKQAAVV